MTELAERHLHHDDHEHGEKDAGNGDLDDVVSADFHVDHAIALFASASPEMTMPWLLT